MFGHLRHPSDYFCRCFCSTKQRRLDFRCELAHADGAALQRCIAPTTGPTCSCPASIERAARRQPGPRACAFRCRPAQRSRRTARTEGLRRARAYSRRGCYAISATRPVPNKNLELEIEDILCSSAGTAKLRSPWCATRVSATSGEELDHSPDRIVAKDRQHHRGELFPRVGFIVTNMTLPSRSVVRF